MAAVSNRAAAGWLWQGLGGQRDPGRQPRLNRRQIGQLLDHARTPVLIAGDFNARPDSESLRDCRDSGRFVGRWDGPPTYPAEQPERTIDYILGPAAWELVDHRVIDSQLSDHRPVLTIFRLPAD